MKNIVFILLSALFFLSCGSSENNDRSNSDWRRFNLKGDVKSFREIKFLAVDNFSIILNGEKIKHIYNQEVLFNLDGNKIEKNDYIPDGTLTNRTVYLYKKHQLVEYNNYDSQGILFGTGKFQTDEDGSPIRLDYKTTDGRYNWSESYEYDNNRNLTAVKRFKTESVIDTEGKYTFDENGNVISSEFHRDNKLISKNTYMCDESNNFQKLCIGDSVIYTFKYNFDEKGNWIKKIVFENDNPSGILLREIEYFN